MKPLKYITRTLLIVSLLIVGASQTFALEARGIGIAPTYADTEHPQYPLNKAWFLTDIGPGESVDSSVTVVNHSLEETTVEVYTVDSTTNNVGGFALEGKGDTPDEVGSWVTFYPETEAVQMVEAILEAGEALNIPFTFAIPAGTEVEPREYSGAIVTSEVVEDLGPGLHIATRVGSRIYNRPPGDAIYGYEIDTHIL